MLSIPHLIVLMLVALVVLGPDKLPEVARTMGKALAELRRVTGDFRYQIEGEMRELDRQARMRETGQKDTYEYQQPGVETPVLPPVENSIAPPAAGPNTPDAKGESGAEAGAGTAPTSQQAEVAGAIASEHEHEAAPAVSGAAVSPEKPGEPHPA